MGYRLWDGLLSSLRVGNKTVMMFGGNGSEVISDLISNEYLTAPCVGIAESYN